MRLSPIEHELFTALSELPIIDAHEHLPAESLRTSMTLDVFSLFGAGEMFDLEMAGMPIEPTPDEEGVNALLRDVYLQDPSRSLEQRWERFAPYYESVRFGSLARAILLAVRDFRESS